MDGRPREESEFDCHKEQDIFLFSTAFSVILGPTETPMQRVPIHLRSGSESSHYYLLYKNICIVARSTVAMKRSREETRVAG
jgi:hypothetical protein